MSDQPVYQESPGRRRPIRSLYILIDELDNIKNEVGHIKTQIETLYNQIELQHENAHLLPSKIRALIAQHYADGYFACLKDNVNYSNDDLHLYEEKMRISSVYEEYLEEPYYTADKE